MATNKHILIQLLKKFNIKRPDTLDDRVKIQKIVYFAKNFGIEFNYNFNIYFRGPYSPELAKDYYNLADDEWESVKEPLNISSEQERKINFIKDKSVRWLEIASTIHAVKSSNPHITEEKLISHVNFLKNTPKNFLSEIYHELDLMNFFTE